MLQISRIADDMLLSDALSETELAASPMTINSMELRKFAGDNGGIDLTNSGFFNRKCVVWAAEEFQWPEYEPSVLYRMNKVLNEQDFPPLSVIHDLMMLGQLMRHRKGKATLTPAGKAMLGHFGKLQALFFETYFTRYDFGSDERFPSTIEHNDYRHFFGVVANRLGDWTTLSDLAHWCLPVPLIPSTRGRPAFEACLHLRSKHVRPLNWLGLIEEADTSHLTPIEHRRSSDSQPDFRVLTQGIEIGAGWQKTGQTSGKEYVSLSIATPEFGPRKLNRTVIARGSWH